MMEGYNRAYGVLRFTYRDGGLYRVHRVLKRDEGLYRAYIWC